VDINEDPAAVVAAMKKAAAALRDADVRFALAGGLAYWARGGVQSDHDCDFVIKPEDADRAIQALEAAGMQTERPPEGWLLKGYDDTRAMVDLIYAPSGLDVDDAVLDRASELVVEAVEMPVMSAQDILTTKLMALTEQHLDLGAVVNVARTVREQIDWDELRRTTAASPFAAGFFTIAERLGIVPAPG
jgi:hypothetical protein